LTELELLYARLWNERISKESRDSSSFMNLQIDLIVFLKNWLEVNLNPNKKEWVTFLKGNVFERIA